MTEKSNKSNDEVQKGRCSLKMQAKCLAKINNVRSFYVFLKIKFPFFLRKTLVKNPIPARF